MAVALIWYNIELWRNGSLGVDVAEKRYIPPFFWFSLSNYWIFGFELFKADLLFVIQLTFNLLSTLKNTYGIIREVPPSLNV